jgi:hypothetical protein
VISKDIIIHVGCYIQRMHGSLVADIYIWGSLAPVKKMQVSRCQINPYTKSPAVIAAMIPKLPISPKPVRLMFVAAEMPGTPAAGPDDPDSEPEPTTPLPKPGKDEDPDPVTADAVAPQAPDIVLRSLALLRAAGVEPQLVACVMKMEWFSRSKTTVHEISFNSVPIGKMTYRMLSGERCLPVA